MRSIVFFTEDYAHEEFVAAIVERFSRTIGVPIKPIPRSVRGGHGKVVAEFRSYLHDLEQEREQVPDLLIVATDANCERYGKRKKAIDAINDRAREITIYAIPVPHIERWLLLDSAAFKAVMGKGCNPPDQKCSRDRYKRLLLEAMRNAGIVPPLGGVEYTRDIVDAMDLQRMEAVNASFGKFLKELHSKFKEWRNE